MSTNVSLGCREKSCPDFAVCSALFSEHGYDKCGRKSQSVPLIDVILPAYNAEEFLERAVMSIARQDIGVDKIRIVVINDGSTDGTKSVAEACQRQCGTDMLIISRDYNKGANYSRNEALSVSFSQYVYFMDADAVLVPSAFSSLINTMSKTSSDVAYAYSGFNRVYKLEDGRLFAEGVMPGDFEEDRLKKGNYISMMSMVKRISLPKRGFDTDIQRLQDWDMWLTLLEKGKVGIFVDKPLFTAMVLPTGISSSGDYAVFYNTVRAKHGLGG